jgi:uncharacterized lipoprotein YmbA
MIPLRYLTTTLIMVLALLASCHTSPPQRFYVLDPVPAKRRLITGPDIVLQVAAVNIPSSVDRQQMVRESAAGSLQISDINRWGAPLADMTQNVLTRDLTERLHAGAVIPPRNNAPPGTYEITVDLLQFGREASGDVTLDGGWSLYRLGSDTPVMSRNVRLSETFVSTDYAAQAQAMTRLLGRLADDIAGSLQSVDGSISRPGK